MPTIEAQLVSSRFQQELVLIDLAFCIPETWVGGTISGVEEIKIKIVETDYIIEPRQITISIDFKVLVLAIVNNISQLITLDHVFRKSIPFAEFIPALDIWSTRTNIDEVNLSIRELLMDHDLLGACTTPDDPHNLGPGTMLRLSVTGRLSAGLSRREDIDVIGIIADE